MFRLFLASFVLGALVSLLGARLYPLPDAPVAVSDSAALANGGREEIFHIRMPGDRLGNKRAAAVADFPTRKFVRQGNDSISAELYRVRNGSGQVIGLASKMSGSVVTRDGQRARNTDWVVMIPGRGSLMMSTGALPSDDTMRYPANRLGFNPTRSGLIIDGTGNFDNLSGFFAEDMDIDSVDENGQLRGVLKIITRMQGGA